MFGKLILYTTIFSYSVRQPVFQNLRRSLSSVFLSNNYGRFIASSGRPHKSIFFSVLQCSRGLFRVFNGYNRSIENFSIDYRIVTRKYWLNFFFTKNISLFFSLPYCSWLLYISCRFLEILLVRDFRNCPNVKSIVESQTTPNFSLVRNTVCVR